MLPGCVGFAVGCGWGAGGVRVGSKKYFPKGIDRLRKDAHTPFCRVSHPAAQAKRSKRKCGKLIK